MVNATGPDGSLTSFSNVGDVRAISAPGADILSTSPTEPTTIWPNGTDGYAPLDGTSMAAPLVSGIAALALSAGVPAADVVDVLMSTAANPTADPLLGAGIVDAAASLGLNAVAAPDAPAEAPEAPAGTPQPDGTVAEQLQDLFASVDGTLDATCTTVRRTLDVAVALPNVETDASLTGQLIIAGFTGAGAYPATGAVTVSLPGQDPLVVPIFGTANVDDAGNGSIEISVESTQIDIAWRCR